MVSLIAQEVQRVVEETRAASESQVEEIGQLVQAFLLQPITPEATWQFENAVENRLRELGRRVLVSITDGFQRLVVDSRHVAEAAADFLAELKLPD